MVQERLMVEQDCRHFDKHVVEQGEFGDITQNQYLKKAKEFGKATGGNIKEADVDKFKVKHNPDTGEVFIGYTAKPMPPDKYKSELSKIEV